MQAFAAAALLLAASIFTPALADTQVGAAAIVVNNVTGTLASTRQRASLRAGIDVFQNETISTGETSASQVLFQDQTSLSIGPMSDVVLDRFVFDPDPSKSQVAVSLAKGVLRFSTGLLPKPDYELTTPTATIGVRGTVLTVTVSDNKTTTVSVGEGSAFVSARGRTVIVDAGFSTLVRPGMPPTNPVGSPPPPGLTTQMLTLLEAAGARLPVGTDVSGRGSPADMPQLNGNMMLSPNIDPQKQSEIRGHKKPGDP
jgi:ferric-dicitrate binding protein FerR (iron transport regulator)